MMVYMCELINDMDVGDVEIDCRIESYDCGDCEVGSVIKFWNWKCELELRYGISLWMIVYGKSKFELVRM